MTRETMEYLVAKWKVRLGLAHWRLNVDWDNPAEEGEVARVDRENFYDLGTMRVAPDYYNWTPEYAEWTVVHELVHLVTRDLEQAVTAAHELLPTTARRLADARFEHELEGAVDRIAAALVGIARA